MPVSLRLRAATSLSRWAFVPPPSLSFKLSGVFGLVMHARQYKIIFADPPKGRTRRVCVTEESLDFVKLSGVLGLVEHASQEHLGNTTRCDLFEGAWRRIPFSLRVREVPGSIPGAAPYF